MNRLRSKIDYILKHNRVFNVIFCNVASGFFRLIGLFIRVDEKSVIFSGHSRKYNDSPKAIYEYLITREDFSDYTFYWALDNPDAEIIPGKCIKIKSDTLKYFITALKCKYWIACVNIERGLKFKKKSIIYLNTWHGIPIKTVGNLAGGRKDYDFSYIDYFCVSGEYEIEIYKKSFNIISSSILKSGLPRNDTLYNTSEQEIIALKKKLGLANDKKIILYAPTWRDSNDGGTSYVIAPPIHMDKWQELLQDDYIVLFRTHPYTNKLLGISFNNFVFDYTNYPDINDLLKISDILISDYSATIFDFAVLERPILCFAYDYADYSLHRGFAMNLKEEMPGGIIETETDLLSIIQNLDYSRMTQEVRSFKKKYLQYGKAATQKCVQALFGMEE